MRSRTTICLLQIVGLAIIVLLEGCAAVAASAVVGGTFSALDASSQKCDPDHFAIRTGQKIPEAPYWALNDSGNPEIFALTYGPNLMRDARRMFPSDDYRATHLSFAQHRLKQGNMCSSEVRLFGPTPIGMAGGPCQTNFVLVECAR